MTDVPEILVIRFSVTTDDLVDVPADFRTLSR